MYLAMSKPHVISGKEDEFEEVYKTHETEIFGEKGRHARSAVGMGSLPNNMAVEIEIIVQVN